MMKIRLSEVDVLGMADEAAVELVDNAATGLEKAVDKELVPAIQTNLRKREGTARTASPAGEPPEMDSGELMRSVKRFRTRRTKYGVHVEYGSDHPGAGVHEFGGTIVRNGKRRTLPPRPYIRPAEASSEAAVEAILEAVI